MTLCLQSCQFALNMRPKAVMCPCFIDVGECVVIYGYIYGQFRRPVPGPVSNLKPFFPVSADKKCPLASKSGSRVVPGKNKLLISGVWSGLR